MYVHACSNEADINQIISLNIFFFFVISLRTLSSVSWLVVRLVGLLISLTGRKVMLPKTHTSNALIVGTLEANSKKEIGLFPGRGHFLKSLTADLISCLHQRDDTFHQLLMLFFKVLMIFIELRSIY